VKKIPSLFKRDYETGHIYNEIVPDSAWVIAGEGIATRKMDGTACLYDANGVMWKRHDCKISKKAKKRKPRGYRGPWEKGDFKAPPQGWVACEDAPNIHTGHWPGWLPIGDGPEDARYREFLGMQAGPGTYELCGPGIGANPEGFDKLMMIRHGSEELPDAPRTFDDIRAYLSEHPIEGIVWHHSDGRMAKIKARDFDIPWPP
jgi:hypothetical protein